jgi:hypothetical protein
MLMQVKRPTAAKRLVYREKGLKVCGVVELRGRGKQVAYGNGRKKCRGRSRSSTVLGITIYDCGLGENVSNEPGWATES